MYINKIYLKNVFFLAYPICRKYIIGPYKIGNKNYIQYIYIIVFFNICILFFT